MKTKTIIIVLIAFVGCIMLAQDAPRGFRNPADVVMMTSLVSTSSPASFLPSDISGLQVWLKNESISNYADGTEFPVWLDSSGNGWNATNNIGNTGTPVVTNNAIGTMRAVKFDGSNDRLQWSNGATNIFNSQPALTIFGVWQAISSENNSRFFYLDTGTAGELRYAIGQNSSGTYGQTARITDGGATDSSAISGNMTGTNHVDSVIADIATHTAVSYVNNFSNAYDASFTVGGTFSSTGSSGMYLGYNSESTVYKLCIIGEFLIYTNRLVSNDIWRVSNYLTNKFSITP